jgi:hypothetical protein
MSVQVLYHQAALTFLAHFYGWSFEVERLIKEYDRSDFTALKTSNLSLIFRKEDILFKYF